MNADQRASIRENAKYLRNVRPIDPEEIAEYVEGQPHPAVVRQILREESLSLGLVECEDGTFEPVSDEPIQPPTPFRGVEVRGVEAFPAKYGHLLEDLLAERFGPNWHEGESGEQLRETIRKLKADYFRNNPVEYDELAVLGYAVYHLPDNYAVVQYVLHELAEAGLLGRKLRVLDVGAGVGGPALGIHDYLPDDALVEYHAVEPSAAADVFEQMLSEARPNFHTEVHRETAEEFEPSGEFEPSEVGETAAGDAEESGEGAGFDLVLFANVLNELDDPESVVLRYLDYLADDGALLAIEPADRETSIGLRRVERKVADEAGAATAFSPTLRLWPDECLTDRGWSFDVKPDLEVPEFQRKLDEAARGSDAASDSDGANETDASSDPDADPGEFVNVDVQFSYAILRPDGMRRVEFTADPDRSAKMAEMERHVTQRIDLVAVKLSHDLAENGDTGESRGDRNPLFKVSDGSESTDHFAVLTNETALNADLRTADYGDLLQFEQVLVLWNDDEEAYNLVVDEETVVDRIPV